jgi:dTDP-4-amino-4,6-dideoxygalactose transaminase
MPVPLLDLAAQNSPLKSAIRQAIDRIVDANAFILGKAVDEMESQLAAYCRSPHALGVASGTDALLVPLMAAGIGPGDEVIVPTFTFFATAGTVARLGARCVFVDIDPVSFNIDPAAAAAAITPRTKAIIPVHLFGQCAEMDPILELGKRHGLFVLEDAAQAIGSRDRGRIAGSMGHVGALSFYPTKNLGAFGDAGAIITPDADMDRRMRVLRVHGQTDEYRHAYVGGNFRIDALQAAILSVKLPHLDTWAAGRRTAAARYMQLLGDLPITLPTEGPGKHHVWNQFTIRTDRRDQLIAHLKERGIGCRVYYPLALHLQPCFADLGYRLGSLPVAEAATQQVLSLPMFAEITQEQQEQVAAALHGFYHS